MSETVKVFVGGGIEHWLPTQVLRSSILRRTSRSVEVAPLREVEQRITIPPERQRKAPTSFSFQRFLIPEACQFQGKGIYVDSDQVVLADIGGLWDTPFPEGAQVLTTGGWQSAVMLIDCAAARWEINDLCKRLDGAPPYTKAIPYNKLSSLKFMKESQVVGALDPRWNCMDELPKNGDPFLVHYTAMRTQPWLKKGHPLNDLWITELLRTIEARHLSEDDVVREVEQGNVRPSLLEVIGRRPSLSDDTFEFPDDRRKRKGAA